MTAATDTPGQDQIGSGIGGWLGFVGRTLTGIPSQYRTRLRQHRGRTIGLTLLFLAIVLYPWFAHYYLADFSRSVFPIPIPDDTVATFMTIFAIMAIGLNIVAGFAGLLDLGYVAFYAIGAYCAAFLASPHFGALGINLVFLGNVGPGASGIHVPFWIIMVVAVIVVATFGALLGAPTLRLRGDYLAIVTLGFGEIVPLFFKNLSSVTFSLTLGPVVINIANANWTGGVQGINPIDPPFIPILNWVFDARSGSAAVYLGLFLLAIAILVARNLERSRMGRAWGAIREDETAAEMMGVNTVRTKLLAFALGASFAGVAGSFQASYLGASTSDFFDFSISILVLIMVILGGIGNIWGAVLGAFALTYVDKSLLPYIGQRIGDIAPSLPNPAEYNFLIYGVILVLMMRFRRRASCRRASARPSSASTASRRPRRRWASRPRSTTSASPHRARAKSGPALGMSKSPGRVATCDAGAAPRGHQDRRDARFRAAREVARRHETVRRAARGQRRRLRHPRGSIVSLIGPNGAGKTTFFNMITGFYTPTTGEISFDGTPIVQQRGKRVKSLKPHEVTALGIGRTFQNIRLFGTMSALDNVKVGTNVHLKSHWWDSIVRTPGMLREEQATVAECMKLLELVDLDHRAETWARNLPYGDQRRLEIARALATRPKLLLLTNRPRDEQQRDA
jgi:branched-chain amino acid transport system permease protein